nr:hypothetical protein [Tanacetum cinerariifolium]
EMVNAYDEKVDFIQELEAVQGVDMAVKTIEEISQDLRLAREINALCDRLTDVVDEREAFANKLDMLAGKEISQDLRLAREINALCDRLTDVVDEREAFANKLDMLAGKYVLGKMVEFSKQIQSKDIPNLMKLQILGREFELRAQEKELLLRS